MENIIRDIEGLHVEAKPVSGDRWIGFDDVTVVITREQAGKLIAELAREEAITRNRVPMEGEQT